MGLDYFDIQELQNPTTGAEAWFWGNVQRYRPDYNVVRATLKVCTLTLVYSWYELQERIRAPFM